MAEEPLLIFGHGLVHSCSNFEHTWYGVRVCVWMCHMVIVILLLCSTLPRSALYSVLHCQSMDISHPPKVHFDEWKTIIFGRKFPCTTAPTNNNCMNKQKPNGLCFPAPHLSADSSSIYCIIEIWIGRPMKTALTSMKRNYLTATSPCRPSRPNSHRTLLLIYKFLFQLSCFVTGNTDLLWSIPACPNA